jgi:flagellar motor switch protein FliM
MRALRMIHESWARRSAISLSAFLRTSVEVNLADIDQGVYTSLIQQIPDEGIYYIGSLMPLPGHFLLHMSLDLAMVVLDRMMGGPGIVFKNDRGLSDLEIELLGTVTDKIFVDFQEAWSNTATVQPRIEDISLNLLLIPIALPTDAMVWVSFEVRVKGNTSSMILGIPYSMLKSISGRLSPYTWLASAESSVREQRSRQKSDVAGVLAKVKVPVSLVLGATRLSVEELSTLRPGDILPLRTPVGGLCPVTINGSPRYLARPGTHRKMLAGRIEQLLESGNQAEEA